MKRELNKLACQGKCDIGLFNIAGIEVHQGFIPGLYKRGFKYCSSCCIRVKGEIMRCPCCNRKLKNNARYIKYKVNVKRY